MLGKGKEKAGKGGKENEPPVVKMDDASTSKLPRMLSNVNFKIHCASST